MDETFELAPRTSDVRTIDRNLFLVLFHRSSARGTSLRHFPPRSARLALLGYRADDLRYHLTRALHLHDVPNAQIFFADEIFIVQRRQLHDHSTDFHRLEHRVRIQRARAPDVHSNFEQSRLTNVGRKLSCDCPPRLASTDYSELVLQSKSIDLHHSAIDRKIQLTTKHVLHLVRPLENILERLRSFSVWRHRDSPFLERLEKLPLCL